MPAATPNPPPAPAKPSPAPKPAPPPGKVLAVRVALVSGAFCAVLALGLVLSWLQYQRVTPLDAPGIAALKAQLLKNPQDEKLKEQIRAEDLRLRRAHGHYLNITYRGAWLLIGGMAVFLVAVQTANWRKKVCIIKQPKTPGAERRALHQAEIAVMGLGVLLGAGAWWLAVSSGTELSAQLTEPAPTNTQPTTMAASFPSAEEEQRHWPRFRGAGGLGLSIQTNVPSSCDLKTGSNVVWQVPVLVQGFSSPIIWGDRLFFSGGSVSNREIVCFDTKTGSNLWRRTIEAKPPSAEEQEIPEQTGVAAASMATDGQRVYAIFGTGDLAALSLEGAPVWSKSLAPVKNAHGHAASLLTWQGRLILQLDQGEADEKKSKLYAFDGASGKIAWQQPRALPSSWATPIVIDAAGKSQVITLGIPLLISYTANDGKELWRAECLANEVTPSPVFADGLLFVVSPSDKLYAFRPDGQGDVLKTHVAWTAEDGIPDVTSPVSNGELVFLVNSAGMLTCYDAKAGKKLWEKDYETEVQASPTLVGNRLYLVGQKGALIVVQAGREFKELARSEMEDKFYASPAFAQNRIYLRGVKQLYCLGQK